MTGEDTRAFDGPHDKAITRRGYMEIVREVLKGRDLAIRVPAADLDVVANRGKVERVDNQPGDTGYRWEHTADVRTRRDDELPVSFDAGACGLWVTPGGWRCLLCYHHDDPTYGINVAVFDPWGKLSASKAELDGYAALDFVREAMP